MRRIIFTLAVLSLIFSTFEVRAEKTELETVVLPAIKGYVLSIDLPKTGTAENWQRSINPDKRGVTIYFSSRSASSSLYFNVWDKPKNFDKYARDRQQNARKYKKVYEDGYNKALGNRTLFVVSSRKTVSVDGKEVKATKPTNKTYITQFDKRVDVEMYIYVGDGQVPPFALPKSLPLFERIARSVKVTPASAMGAGQLRQYFSSPKIQVSRRRDYYLKATATMALPPGWAAQVVTADPASGSRESGRVVVELTPRRKPLADRYEKLRLVLEGVEIRNVFSLPGFLDTARVYLAAELPNPEKIRTPKTVAMPVSNDGSGYCNMWRKVRRGVSTDKVYVSTYAGKDTNGQDRKVRVYTAGGFTLACNIIYTADPKTFDASQERIGAILKSLSIRIEMPLGGL